MKIKLFVLILISLFIVDDVSAQRRRKKKKRRKPTTEQKDTRADKEEAADFKDKLNYEIKVGSLNFNGGFGLGLKGNAGYKINKSFTAGVGGKMQYNFLNLRNQPDISLIDIGGLAFVRGKITESIYLQGEYNLQSFDSVSGVRTTQTYPLIGGGYVQGLGDWSSGIELLFILDEGVREVSGQVIEYWVSFSYNF